MLCLIWLCSSFLAVRNTPRLGAGEQEKIIPDYYILSKHVSAKGMLLQQQYRTMYADQRIAVETVTFKNKKNDKKNKVPLFTLGSVCSTNAGEAEQIPETNNLNQT